MSRKDINFFKESCVVIDYPLKESKNKDASKNEASVTKFDMFSY